MEDAITKARTKSPRSDHVDLSAEQCFQINLELGMVEEATAELEVHEDVDVTIRARLSAGHGSEHSDVAGAVSPAGPPPLALVPSPHAEPRPDAGEVL